MPERRLIHLLSSSLWGGREQYALDICRGFSAAGWNVSVITRDASAVDTPFIAAGIKVRHLPLGHYSGVSSIISLVHLLRRGKAPCTLHVHTFRDAFLALTARKLSRRKDTRVVFTCHRVKPCRNTAMRRRILRNLHAVIFPSALACNTFLSTWSPVELPLPKERIHLLHNSLYRPFEGEVPPSPPVSGPIVVSYYGRIVQGKGLETFISALPLLKGKRTRACIAGAGDPDYIDTLKRLATRLGVMDMIDWRGNSLSREQTAERSHIGVFPSLEPEAFGQGNLVFMAYGRPQICTFNGAQGEYLTAEKEALLIQPADTEALAADLLKLIEHPELRLSMGRAAHKRFNRRLEWGHFADILTHIYS